MATKKNKAKAIEFDVLAHLKTLPQDFWLQVPTAGEHYNCEGLSDTKRIALKSYGPTDSIDIRPAFCDEFPEFAELYDKYLSPAPQHCLERTPRRVWVKGQQVEHDWAVSVIGSVRLQYATSGGWQVSHDDFDGEFYAVGRLYSIDWNSLPGNPRAKTKQDAYDKRTWYTEQFVCGYYNKKFGSHWNRLRKNARREAGLDLPPKKAKALADKKRAVQLTKARMATLLHIDKLVENLQAYKKLVQDSPEDISMERVREIFNDTNEMTSLNAKLKKALGV